MKFFEALKNTTIKIKIKIKAKEMKLILNCS